MPRPDDLLIFDWGEPDQTICLEWQIVPANDRPRWAQAGLTLSQSRSGQTLAGPGVREPLPSRQGWLEQSRP